MSVDNPEFNYQMRRPISPAFGLLRLGLCAATTCLLGGAAPAWAVYTYLFCFSVSLLGDFLFGITPGMFAGGSLIGLGKWGAFVVMLYSAVEV